MTNQNNNDTPIFSGGGSELYKNGKPMQNNNEEWREEFDETISNVMGIMQIDSLKIKDFIAFQISQAKQQGKREGLEEAEEIIANYAEEESESAILKRIRKKINQLK